jgi:hypothetical protein
MKPQKQTEHAEPGRDQNRPGKGASQQSSPQRKGQGSGSTQELSIEEAMKLGR